MEVEHRVGGRIFVQVTFDAPLSLIELWGPVSEEQLEAIMGGPDGSIDRVLEEILTGG